MKFDSKVLRRFAELLDRNRSKLFELSKEYRPDPVTYCYDQLGRMTSATVHAVHDPRLLIDLDGTVTQIDADGNETVIATLE